ncbi:uncharacterized protein LOC114467666 [Gouania willdenowi]|uniref:uncharacterized protein LOC114467666 n=1 Tax=Gouania willdenowi TaxID=441366 RepID=UPI0010544EBD|nr:uncharacterized protein LOC114467666 [Gouania willdenowi]
MWNPKMTNQSEGTFIQDLSRPLEDTSFSDEAISILTSTSQRATTILSHTSSSKPKDPELVAGSSCDEDAANNNNNSARRKRDLIPNEKKDDGYWDKRRKNNEAAKRSREKRRANDMVLEQRILGLLEENAQLRAELLAVKFRFGLVKDPSDMSICSLSAPTPSSTKHPIHTNGVVTELPPPQGVIHGLRAAEAGSQIYPEGSGVFTLSTSSIGSLVYGNDTLEEGSSFYVRQATEHQLVQRQQESQESLRSLPHKLRFKGGEITPSHSGPPVAMVGPNIQTRNQHQLGGDPQTKTPEEAEGSSSSRCLVTNRKCSQEEISLRSQISCLSQEVAQLKRLVTQQLIIKIS